MGVPKNPWFYVGTEWQEKNNTKAVGGVYNVITLVELDEKITYHLSRETKKPKSIRSTFCYLDCLGGRYLQSALSLVEHLYHNIVPT